MQNPNYKWWLKKEPHKEVYNAFNHIRTRDDARLEGLRKNLRLYGNQNILGFGPGTYHKTLNQERVTLNVIKAAIDTVAARIGKHAPRPRFLTTGGNFTLRRKAKLLQQWTDAQFHSSGLARSAQMALVEACVQGTGILKVFSEGETICAERVFPGEVFVDHAEGLYGKPRQMFQRKYISKTVLAELFPACAKAIETAKPPDGAEEGDYGLESLAEMVEVVEGWHLPSGPGATDGKHCICIDGDTLYEEDWVRDHFPFVFIRWTESLRGFWGLGLCDELVGIQVEINRLLQKVQKAFHLLSAPQVWVESGSQVKTAQINNEIGSVYKYTGQRPVVVAPQTINPEIFMHIERLYSKAFEISGVSRMSATGNKPAGLESGVALREYHDIESERFALVSKAYEDLFMEATSLFIEEGKSISQRNPKYSVVAQKDKNTIAEVKWKDVDMDKDSYVLQVFPASSLPTTPSGRLAFVEQMVAGGMLGPTEAKRLLNFPDMDAELSLEQAVNDNIDRVIELMLDEGVYEAPEPFGDLQLSLKKVQAAYNRGVVDGVPEENLELLRQHMSGIRELQKRMEMEAMNASPQPMPGAPPPPGPTGASPTAVMPTDGVVT